MIFSPFFTLGRAVGQVSAPSNLPLSVVGIVTFNTTSTLATYTKTVTPPGSADAILVIATSRANGAGVNYAATCTVGGNSATKIEGNENTATSDNFVHNSAFFIRGSFNAANTVDVSVAFGNTTRPGGFVCIFLKNTRVATAVGGKTTARGTTSSATLAGSVTPTSTDSIVFILQSTYLGSGTPTVSTFTPTATDLGTSQLGSTLGARSTRHLVPADTNAISISITWSAAGTSRGLIAVEIVR